MPGTETLLVDIVRLTARVSGTLLFLVLAASGTSRFGAPGVWLDRQSAAMFLAFAAAHAGHLIALVLWAALFPASFFADRPIVPLVAGALLYVVIGRLALRAWRCLADGRLRLTRMQVVGLYALWAVFAAAFMSRAGDSGVRRLLAGAALVALVLRLFGRADAEKTSPPAEVV